MCGRFTQSLPLDWIEAWLQVDEVDPACADLDRPRYNIAPAQRLLVVARRGAKRVLTHATFGFAAARDRRLVFNARSETVATHSRFREAFSSARCVVPASGFYEWETTVTDRKQPWYVHASTGHDPLLAFAGILEVTAESTRCAILTTTPNRPLVRIHDRMPAVIERGDVGPWLSAAPSSAARLLGPAAEDRLTFHRVAPRVNRVTEDDAALTEPV
jgi:putative SOS response-associated peptidase YedK